MTNKPTKYLLYLYFVALQNLVYATTKPITQSLKDSVYIDAEPLKKHRRFSNLKDRYKSEAFNYNTEKQSGWWTQFKTWLSEVFKDFFDLNSDAKASEIVDFSLKIFYVIIFILVIYFIVKAIINKDGRWLFIKSSHRTIISAAHTETDINTTDFKTLIIKAEQTNNYRLAIRYYYLWLLQVLSENNIIAYDVEKTNSDYYNEITSKAIKKEFSYTAYLYNYIWYGSFIINYDQFTKAKSAFIQVINTLKNE